CLPPGFLAPITETLKLLVQHYGVTVLFCTATQPNLSRAENAFGHTLFAGIENVREIVPDPPALYDTLRRVQVHMPPRGVRSNWEEIAARILQHEQTLSIVNTRSDCRALFKLLPTDSGRVHLSALMCAEHRGRVIAGIKQCLRDGSLLHVVSTQLVEAGVDLDFPVVFRALAGLDSIAQAAGRCNREGRMPTPGQTFVFRPLKPPPAGLMRDGADIAEQLLALDALEDMLSPPVFQEYFRLFFARQNLDMHDIVGWLKPDRELAISFRTAAEKFRLIDENGQASVIVPYCPPGLDESPILMPLAALEKDPGAKWAYRHLQRYTVNVAERLLNALLARQDVEVRAGLYVLRPSRYDADLGLLMPDDFDRPENLMC
ncbi:MAG: CRISPR-associated helicase/endonuclease Cas3, partial [Longimicrobiales bacterium]